MTSFYLAALVLCSAQAQAAEAQVPIRTVQNGDDSSPNFTYDQGFTLVSKNGYQLRCTAQQRISDNMLQVVVYPSEMNLRFQIQDITFGDAPAQMGATGPVAQVQGQVTAQTNNSSTPTFAPLVIPVQVQPVSDFTLSTQEAKMQGYPVFEKSLPNLVTQ